MKTPYRLRIYSYFAKIRQKIFRPPNAQGSPIGRSILGWLKFSLILCFSCWGPHLDSEYLCGLQNFDEHFPMDKIFCFMVTPEHMWASIDILVFTFHRTLPCSENKSLTLTVVCFLLRYRFLRFFSSFLLGGGEDISMFLEFYFLILYANSSMEKTIWKATNKNYLKK